MKYRTIFATLACICWTLFIIGFVLYDSSTTMAIMIVADTIAMMIAIEQYVECYSEEDVIKEET